MRSEFKSTTQIYVSPIYFELQLILRNHNFFHTWTLWPKSMNRKNCPKLFHRVIFAFWIQIYNPNLCKSQIYFELQLILRNYLFLHTWTWWPKSMNRKNCPKLFHRVIFAFRIQIYNPNLCKFQKFWITANIEKLSFSAYPDLMTKIDEIGKITRNSFIG